MYKRIEINDRFDLMYDGCGNKYLVEKKKSKKTKKDYEMAYCGYHLKFEYLLKAYNKKRLPEMSADSVTEVLENMVKVEREIYELSKRIGEKLQQTWNSGA